MTEWPSRFADLPETVTSENLVVSTRTLRAAIDDTLMAAYTRVDLEIVLAEELKLVWPQNNLPGDAPTKRDLIWSYTPDWTVPQLVGLARQIVAECNITARSELPNLITEYDKRGGVTSPAKNLIFAANGPKPELVLRDAVNNDIEITKNAEYCLVFDAPIPAGGLTFAQMVQWWRQQARFGDDVDDRTVGLSLHDRLRASIGDNGGEQLIFDTYCRRYKSRGFEIPALIPQVYLHYDPYTIRTRGEENKPLTRQRMDFLIFFSDRQRVVIELDGKQHYSDKNGAAAPTLYAQLVAEDRRLRLAGYEVYRFGGQELTMPDAAGMLSLFFDELQHRMR
ncbi:endonuclease domain-containing protein [Nocardia noduli]|uniref:endonuclease domain-containing protein n=1 Tax=Nocardia noduli TaxID=2815722 RepID=UPI001C232E65|nr:endonuclease domain-containing protein [Nocardia noduli]